MSDCINVVTFNKDSLRLVMKFDGDNYETASVKFNLEACDNRPKLEEDVIIPVRCLFALGYLALMSVRRTVVQYEIEVQEMQNRIAQKKHPLKPIGGLDGQENNKEKIKNRR